MARASDIAALPRPAKGNKRYPDKVRGLNILVTAGGWRGFVLRYRVAGRQRQMTIGEFPAWSISAARARALELRRLVDQGIDPLQQEADDRAAGMTVSSFYYLVYEPLHVETKRPSWARDVRSMVVNDIIGPIGGLAVQDLDQADIAAMLRHVSKRAPVRANRVRAVLSHLCAFAERAHVLDDGTRIPPLRPRHSNPVEGIPRNGEDARQRYLSQPELAALATVLEHHKERISVALVRFLLLTGCRFGEAAGATWDQFDFERGTWTKPSSHTKQKRVHTVPLSAPALALLAELRAADGAGPYLFPGATGKPITTVKSFWRSVTRQAGLEGVRVHDLRHSFASLLASSGASLLLIGQLLGHTQSVTTQRYSHLLDDVQREAVERAAAVIGGRPGEVVPLLGTRKAG
jgi:integrase